ncbi:MAG: PQQ-binding-like beta-propeller repeat protein, partial [Dehalococcoidia bacterium]
MNRPHSIATLLALLVMAAFGRDAIPLQAQQSAAPESWSYFGGDKNFTRYSPLEQIHRGNVEDLQILWRRSGVDQAFSRDYPDVRHRYGFTSTPIYIEGVLYAPNAVGLVEAFDPSSGRTIWRQEPRSAEEASGQSTRGVDYWSEGEGGRIVAVRGQYLYALDGATGEEVRDFGDGGRVNLTPPAANRFHWSSGPIIVGDVVVVAGNLDGAGDSGAAWRGSASEDVRGYDVRSGHLLWTFHAVPREGEFGADTWGNESREESGDLGSWCCLSADEELGYVYVPFSAPTAAYYGGHRPGDNLFSNTLVALDAHTGERVWHFQMIHHDVWEYDVVGPPTLGEVTVDGRPVDAVMQPAKTGWVYVFDRATGEPVWPIIERPVPESSVPEEALSPTQPFPTKPAPFDQQGVTLDDLIDFTPELHAQALAIADSFVVGPMFTPPSIVSPDRTGTKGTYSLPGSWGSGNWNTGAFD